MGELDLHLLDAGRHFELHDRLGAHLCSSSSGHGGVHFSVWAPAAGSVSVVGDWNNWVPDVDAMQRVGFAGSGVWEVHVDAAAEGHRYKFVITDAAGRSVEHSDPLARQVEGSPSTGSIVHRFDHSWGDGDWMTARGRTDAWARPMSVYEVHVGSWRRWLARDGGEPADREPTFREIAHELADYATTMGFTHVELMPVMAHPFGGSWGYQVTSFFAPAPRWGTPEDLAFLIDTLHQAGVGVILDWVPAHFPKDEWALARFDGTALYEHHDPRRGEHPDWGTLIFDHGRGGVRSFLLSSAQFWLDRFHVDGLRVDAVASMLYLDYSRAAGEWLPNEHGGRENLEAVSLFQELHQHVQEHHHGTMVIAEESTAWPGVTAPIESGGLGFDAKWNMGWMHDTLQYFAHDPIHRRFHHNDLTFSLAYAFSERFVLPLSHDEVVHQKHSLLNKMPGDRWQQLANLRALFGWMWAHPGKQLLFMGGEIAQEREWDHDRSLDWDLLDDPSHLGIQRLVADLNRLQRESRALWVADAQPEGFDWLVRDDAGDNVAAFLRRDPYWPESEVVACVANLSPVPRHEYKLKLPFSGRWSEVLNTDSGRYGGSGIENLGVVHADPTAVGDGEATIALPPLGVIWLRPEPRWE